MVGSPLIALVRISHPITENMWHDKPRPERREESTESHMFWKCKTMLEKTVRFGKPERALALLQNGAEVTVTAMGNAVYNGNVDVVAAMLKRGGRADMLFRNCPFVHSEHLLTVAINRGNLAMIALISGALQTSGALLNLKELHLLHSRKAVENDNDGIVKCLLRHTSLSKNTLTNLFAKAIRSTAKVEMIREFVEAGADINDTDFTSGTPAVMLATTREVAEYLVSAGSTITEHQWNTDTTLPELKRWRTRRTLIVTRETRGHLQNSGVGGHSCFCAGVCTPYCSHFPPRESLKKGKRSPSVRSPSVRPNSQIMTRTKKECQDLPRSVTAD